MQLLREEICNYIRKSTFRNVICYIDLLNIYLLRLEETLVGGRYFF
jgi:hypothetical protein